MKKSLTTLFACLILMFIVSSVSALDADETIRTKFAAMYGLDTATYTIDILSNNLKSADVSAEQLTLRPLSQKEPLGLFSMMADVKNEGELLESAQIRLKIRKFADVLVLLDNVRRSKSIAPEQLLLKRMEVTNLRQRPLVELSELEGVRAGRNLKRGAILTADDLELIPDVENGRDVSIVYTEGMCRISADGRALQAGLAGDYIKVKNKSSGKIILARVVDATAVAVDP
ncbi:MAG: flagellar basal body P-ring formation chaperone FlgA [candidate division Zixibacteria bacterium]|nr:flagellar basal body P-ring formation chaperone FlgA [candidate division Zixibacteria bacterium]MDH3938634.1 flagellar basal body P-ring formation chaperone FlgA [candidate division Zixibacteria bacterium]MDH4034402.1 flagellar basal body P-ring formation chaperone FlgA [candidate division Zixibacteria bacterium]